MKVYSSGPLSAKDRVIVSTLALLSLVVWHNPAVATAYAQTPAQNALVFQIKPNTNISSSNTQPQLIAEAQLAQIDKRVEAVRTYLESKNAPLAQYTEILLAQDDWKKILAISNAESNMGRHCSQNNCSGIMYGKGGLRSYNTIPDWIVDLQGLIDRRYKTMSLDKMNGIYVQPRSANWYQASSKVYNDLEQIEKQTPITPVLNAA